MSATIVANPSTAGTSRTHAPRAAVLAMLALAVVVLLALSFAVGRSSVSTTKAPAVAPTAGTSAGTSTGPATCRVTMGRPC